MPQPLQDSGFFVFPGLSWHILAFLFTQFLCSHFLGRYQDCFFCFPISVFDGVPVLAHKQYPLVTSLYLWLPTKYCNLWKQMRCFYTLMASDSFMASDLLTVKKIAQMIILPHISTRVTCIFYCLLNLCTGIFLCPVSAPYYIQSLIWATYSITRVCWN